MATEDNVGSAVEPQAPDTGAAPAPKMYAEDYVRDLRKESKERREEIRTLREELDQLKAGRAQPSATQPDNDLSQRMAKLEADLETERKQAAAAKHDALKLRVGTAFGLPPELSEVLQGENEEALRAHAEKLKAILPAATGQPNPRIPGGSTTAVPGGNAHGETDAQKRARLRGSNGGGLFGS
jgi:hypothetical protein